MAAQAALKKDLRDRKATEKEYDDALHRRFVLYKDQSDGKGSRSLTRIAAMINRSAAAVSQYANKKFVGDLVAMEKDIANLLRRDEDLGFVSGPKIFCSTSPSILIWEVLQYCDKKSKMGVALGPSGIGKTETCKEYKRQNRATIFATADITTRKPSHILSLLVSHTGGMPRRSTISGMLHAVIDKLKASHRMIILDDAHFLSWEAFETVRKIHDCAQIGVVFIGQERLYDQMRGLNDKNRLWDQIYSRITIKRDYFKLGKKDVRMVAESLCPGLDKECMKYLYKKASGKGKLRVIANLLDVALEIHKEYDTPLGIGLLQEAERFLMTDTRQ